MSQMPEPNQFLKVRGANEHNLQNVDINIPKNKLIVMTGVSGSGKVHLHLTQYTQKAREDMLNHSQHTLASFFK